MTDYTVIRVYTSEKARYEGKDLSLAIVSYIRSLKIAARCVVFRGQSACYENGEISTSHIVDISYNLPINIDIIAPSSDSDRILGELETMVVEGYVCVFPATIHSFRSSARLFPKNLRAGEIMTKKPSIAHLDFTIRAVAELLLDTGLKSLPVVDDEGICVGIITQSDLLARAHMPVRLGLFGLIANEERETWLAEAEKIRCASVMTVKPKTVRETTKVGEAVHLMNRERLKRLPVVDERGSIVGMLSRIDVLKAIAAESAVPDKTRETLPKKEHPKFVREIEVRDSFSLPPVTPIKTAIDALIREGCQRAAVVDSSGKLVGLVSDEMLVRSLEGKGRRSFPFSFFRRSIIPIQPISTLMLREIKTVSEDKTIDEAIALMTEFGFKRIPVVDADGVFRGMIRRDSVLLAFAHTY